MTNCEEYAALISAGVDDALTADERLQLNAHLAECPACREVFAQLCAMHDAFAAMEAEELPGDLAGAVMTKIRAEKAAAKRRRRAWLPVAAAAACCALVFIGYRALDMRGDSKADATAADMMTASSFAGGSGADNGAVLESDGAMADSEDLPDMMTEEMDALTAEQIISAVVTNYAKPPEEGDAKTVGASPLAGVRTCSFTSEAAAEWMEANADSPACPLEDDSDGVAWLIPEMLYEELLAYLEDAAVEFTDLTVSVDSGDAGGTELVCVIYYPTP